MKMFAADANATVTYRDAIIRVRRYRNSIQHTDDTAYELGEFSGMLKCLNVLFGNEPDDLDALFDVVRDYVPLA